MAIIEAQMLRDEREGEILSQRITRLDNECYQTLNDEEKFTKEEIGEISKNEAPRLGKIEGDVKRKIQELCLRYVLILYNECLKEGKFIKSWRTGKVILIHQEKQETNLNPIGPLRCFRTLRKL